MNNEWRETNHLSHRWKAKHICLQYSHKAADNTPQNRCSTYVESNCWMHYTIFYLKPQENPIFQERARSLSLIPYHSNIQD